MYIIKTLEARDMELIDLDEVNEHLNSKYVDRNSQARAEPEGPDRGGRKYVDRN